LSQFGLFKLGYVTKLVTWLPGATVFRDGEKGAKG
ncbi:phosphate ABC transporter permease, partial [Halobacteriales archaeon QH_2_66_30]